MIEIRNEEAGDLDAISEIYAFAFGRAGEWELVNRLRDAGVHVVSLVAEKDGARVGHILFTPVTVGGEHRGAGLAPMAVLPDFQRRGIGSRLVDEGLEACRERGFEWAVVLGHAHYYPRFGFRPAKELGLSTSYPVPDEVFMAQELVPGALDGVAGTVRYHPEFDAVGG